MDKEGFYNELADLAINLHTRDGIDLTSAVRKVAEENACNDHDKTNLTNTFNLKFYKLGFAHDRLFQFDAVKVDDVLSINPTVEKVAEVYEAGSMLHKTAQFYETLEKDAEESEQKDDQMFDLKKEDEDGLRDAAVDNADVLSNLKGRQEATANDMYNTVKSMAQNGEPIQGIKDFILQAMGQENSQEAEKVFSDIMAQLEQEGVVVNEEPSSEGVPKTASINGGIDKEHRLYKLAQSYIEDEKNILKSEIFHVVCCDKLMKLGYDSTVFQIEDMVGWELKNAGKYWEDALSQKNEKTAAPFGMNDQVLPTVLTTGGALLALTAAITGGNALYEHVQRTRLKDKLRTRYPDLQQIPEPQYNDLYDSITNLSPSLMKAPYVLAESIKKHHQYGTIDPSSANMYMDMQHKANNRYYAMQDTMTRGAVPAMKTNVDMYN